MLTKRTRILLLLIVAAIMAGAAGWPSFQQSLAGLQQRLRHRQPPPAGDQGDGSVRFVDVADKAGLRYRWAIPGPRPIDILQGIGNGCAFLDYDNSGNLSILLVGPKLALYKGDGRGHFTDVTHQTGLDRFHGHFLGCAVGDYDNDGYDDLYISGYRAGLLLHNDGGKSFRDVTRQAGLTPQPWGTSCAFADIDNDGRLDLFVGDYVRFDPSKDQRLCPTPGGPSGCGPQTYNALHGVLYHNEGNGRFRDVTQAWTGGHTSGKVLGAAFADFNASGRPSLYLANDLMPGDLLQNRGDHFQNTPRAGGVADTGGQNNAGMGVDWGDYDNDGRPDLFVGTFALAPKPVYHNLGQGVFEETSESLGLREPTFRPLTFGTKWLDYDNDGWLDLIMANGHVRDNATSYRADATFLQPTLLFHNDHGRRLEDVSGAAGADIAKPILGRGLAIGDYDNDGKVDVLIVDSQGAPLLLHNESRVSGHWLSFALIGTRSNRDGYGASVTVTAGGLTQTRWCHADGSYLSSSDKRVHVGLGAATVAQSVTVRWPSGAVTTLRNVPADRQLTVQEGR
ncbi:MAG: CRTAC1 family protein [Armatimonadetes bacterium]|nr:CRTAC1 family protein [Armatimonadota bacterium]